VALATLKRDRFASLETGTPDAEPCRVLTKPLIVSQPQLYLNAATWGKGTIRVEVLTRDWQPVRGFTVADSREVQGDALDNPVRWTDNADLGKLLGKEVRLKFHMTSARLHAMAMSEQVRPLGTVEKEYHFEPAGDSAPRQN